MEQLSINQIISDENVIPVVILSEDVLDGTNSNKRPLVLEYTKDGVTVEETRLYVHPAHHAAWGLYKSVKRIKDGNE